MTGGRSLRDGVTGLAKGIDPVATDTDRAAAAAARRWRDTAALLGERNELLLDELRASQRVAAAALGLVEDTRAELRTVSVHAAELADQLAALQATRTFRYTRRLRGLYGKLRARWADRGGR